MKDSQLTDKEEFIRLVKILEKSKIGYALIERSIGKKRGYVTNLMGKKKAGRVTSSEIAKIKEAFPQHLNYTTATELSVREEFKGLIETIQSKSSSFTTKLIGEGINKTKAYINNALRLKAKVTSIEIAAIKSVFASQLGLKDKNQLSSEEREELMKSNAYLLKKLREQEEYIQKVEEEIRRIEGGGEVNEDTIRAMLQKIKEFKAESL